MSWSKQLLTASFGRGTCPQFKFRPERGLIDAPRVSRSASLRLLHLAHTSTGRIGLPARCTSLGHQVLQGLCFAVEHCAGVLAAQHDKLERTHEHPIELAVALAETDWQQRGERILL